MIVFIGQQLHHKVCHIHFADGDSVVKLFRLGRGSGLGLLHIRHIVTVYHSVMQVWRNQQGPLRSILVEQAYQMLRFLYEPLLVDMGYTYQNL